MSDKVYDILNKIQRWLPLVGIFYLALSQIWNLPLGDQINQTIVAVATLLAGTLEIATVIYKQKTSKIDELEGEEEEEEDDEC